VRACFSALAGRPDESINLYQAILAKSPDFIQGRYRYVEVLMQRGKLPEARAQIDELLKKDAHNRRAPLPTGLGTRSTNSSRRMRTIGRLCSCELACACKAAIQRR